MTRVVLVRHGQSSWNAAGRIQGQLDSPLSALGRRQAGAVADRLAGVGLAAVYSSPLRRAQETAVAVAQRHGLPVTAVTDLTEIDHGRWQGLTEAEIAAQDRERLHLWNLVPGRVRMPDGERLYDVRRRAQREVRMLVASHADQAIAVVSHDIVVKVLVADVLGMDYDHLGRLVVDNGSISIAEYANGCGRVTVLNDTAHLAALSLLAENGGLPPQP